MSLTPKKGNGPDSVFSRKKIAVYLAASAVYLVITLVMFWPITLNITSVTFKGSDPYNSLWTLWYVSYALLHLHTSIYSTNLVFYPINSSLVVTDLMPLAGIFTIPIQRISLTFAYNFLVLLGFVLSGLFMYMLAYHLVKNDYAAFVAGLIFAFSPIHIAHGYFHLDWTSVEFIPLFILLFMLSIKRPERKYILGASVSFVLLSFFGDLQQAILVINFLIAFVLYLLFKDRKSLNKTFALTALEIFAIAALISSPFLIPILKTLLSTHALATSAVGNNIPDNYMWSNNVLAFFVPSIYNNLLAPLAHGYYQIYQQDLSEDIAFVGYTVFALCIAAFAVQYKRKRNDLDMWLWITLVFAFFSTGPLVVFGKYLIYIGPYFIYHFIPILNIIREPGRFFYISTVGLAIIASYGTLYLLEYMKKKKLMINHALLLTALLSILILIEYNGMPLSSSVENVSYTNTSISAPYYALGRNTANYSVLILPDNNTYYAAMGMYYQTAFKKPIIGGYLSRANSTQYSSAQEIPLVSGSAIPQANGTLEYSYPILENYTALTLFWMSRYRVGFVGVDKQALNSSREEQTVEYMQHVFGNPLYEGNSTLIFSTTNATMNPNTTMVAYTNGTWTQSIPCPNGAACTERFGSLWFGNNTRYIDIFSPDNASVSFYMQAFSYSGPENLTVSANGKLLMKTVLAPQIKNVLLNLTLSKGINEVSFVGDNETNSSVRFGIGNVTLTHSGK
jgi:hypothetical protein